MRDFRMRISMFEPSASEIRQELAKILQSRHFRNAEAQSNLLKIVVEKALAGETIDETDLTPGEFRSESTRGRANASIVRKKLESYNESEGKNDFVTISFPPGAAYKPEFQLNGGTMGVDHYIKGLIYRSEFSLNSLHSAEIRFSSADRWFVRKIAPALIAYIETNLMTIAALTILGVGNQQLTRRCLLLVEDRIKKLDERCPDYLYLSQLFKAVVALYKADWKEAELRIDSAISLDADHVGGSLWYAFYLSVFGRWEEAESIVMRFYEDNRYDPLGNLFIAAFYYRMREFSLVPAHLAKAYRPDGGATDAAYLLEGLVSLGVGLSQEAWREFSKISTADWCLETELYVRPIFSLDRVPGLKMLAAHGMNKDEFRDELSVDLLYPRKAPSWKELMDPTSELLSGLGIPNGWRPLQKAFAEMANDRIDKAVDALERAYEAVGFVVVWPPTLPVFDLLRESPKFKALVHKIAYPSGVK